MNRPGKGRSKNCVKWCKNSGKSNSAKQLLFQLDADELKKELVLTKNSTSKRSGVEITQM
jgi:hypothetical protein